MRTVEEATARGAGTQEGGRRGGGRLGGGRQGVMRLRLRANAAQLLQLSLEPLGRPRRLARPGRLAPRAQLLLFSTRLHLRQCLEGPATPRHCCLSHSPSLTSSRASPPPQPRPRTYPVGATRGHQARAHSTQLPRTGKGRRRQRPHLHQLRRLVRSWAASFSASPAATLAHRRSACERPTASRAPRTWEMVGRWWGGGREVVVR